MRRIAVIDIGSNSIKCLVALERKGGGLASVYENTLPVRISAGISAESPRLGITAMSAGAEAVAQLVSECGRVAGIEEIIIVATSAVRDAANAEDFIQGVYTQTGLTIRVLSGDEEAELIGRGVIEDPIVVGQYDHFTVADLGGGSLELIAVDAGKAIAQASLPLGAVRLTEKYLPNPKQAIDPDTNTALEDHIRGALEECGFPLGAPIIGTGGMVTVWRSMEAQAQGVTLPELSPVLSQSSLHGWIYRLQQMSWSERLNVPGLPASRADIVVPGMIVIDQILQLAGAKELTHSRFNLRYGVAAEWFQTHAKDA
jgi:exopolyphosphatase/guanosine-5'-triphosphate,3'-diphosphate pyrophosphatase